MKKIIILLVITLVVIGIYLFRVNREEYIKNHMWKYNDGAHFGDVLIFENGNDDLKLVNNKLDSENTFFSYGFRLIIKDVKTGEEGIYSNKGSTTN